MSKQIFKLYENGLGDEIKKYMRNLNDIAVIKSCVDKSAYTSNVYKTVASFEDAGIVNSAEVPVGDEKRKMNFLLAAAISKLAPIIKDNLKLAGEAAKRWNDQVGDDNNQERLNAVMAKLKMPVKDQAIPSYSSLTADQRVVVQRVFQETLKKQEPLSIDFIIEAIDRYNAGADRGVMFDKLGLVLDQSTSIAEHDQSKCDALMTDDMFAYMLTRWESYKKMVNAISSETSLTAVSLSEIVDTARFSKSVNLDSLIKSTIKDLDFNKPLDEYKASEKATTSFADIKPYLQNNGIIKSLSNNNANRLRGLCTIISQLDDMDFYHIDTEQSDIDSEDSYHALSVYFEVMEEITQNLMVFLFITQTTVRNSTMVQDIISVVNTVDTVLTDLFTRVGDATVVTGNVSQEGFKDILDKILGKKNHDGLNLIKNNPGNLKGLYGEYLDYSNQLLKLKLKDNNSLNDDTIVSFKKQYGEIINKTYGVNISKMDVHSLFEFMTGGIFDSKLTQEASKAMSCDLLFSPEDTPKYVLHALTNTDVIHRLLVAPQIEGARYSFMDCVSILLYDFSQLVNITVPGKTASDIQRIVESVSDNVVNGSGSYFRTNDDVREAFGNIEFDIVPATKYRTTHATVDSFIGYRNVQAASLMKVFETFKYRNKHNVTLKNIKGNTGLLTIADLEPIYTKVYGDVVDFMNNERKFLMLKKIEKQMAKDLVAITNTLRTTAVFNKEETAQYVTLAQAIAADFSGALDDLETRNVITTFAYNKSAGVTGELINLFKEFNVFAEDFIKLAK